MTPITSNIESSMFFGDLDLKVIEGSKDPM